MKKQVFICDKCGIQIPDNEKPFLFSLFHERKSNSAGSSEEYHYQSDLCLDCVIILANRFMLFFDKNIDDPMFKADLVKTFNAVSR